MNTVCKYEQCEKNKLTCAVRHLEFHGDISSCKYNEALKYIILDSLRNSLSTLLLVEVSQVRLSCILFVRYC